MEQDKQQSLEARLNREIIKPGSKITTIVSGGMDSVTLLYFALSKTPAENITAISFNYGQKHSKELESAKTICQDIGVDHRLVDLQTLTGLLKSSLTTDAAVPHGHYAEDNMKATVVPNRNAIMLSIAYGAAVSGGDDYLLFGAHTGDHAIYPDCRPEFVKALDKAFRLGNKGFSDTKLKGPFLNITKSEIATVGLALGVPYEKTWTCYEGQDQPCLSCGTCVERTEAFLDNNTQDPLLNGEQWQDAVGIHAEAVRTYEAKG